MLLKIKSLSLIFVCLSVFISACSNSVEAPNIKLTDLETAEVGSLSDYKGQYVYIDFWASWCGPCLKSFPFMYELQNKYEKLAILAISVDEDKEDAKAFLAKTQFNFKVFHDPQGEAARQFDLGGMPTSYLIDPNGNIVSTYVGFSAKSKAKIAAEIEGLNLN